MQRSAVHPCTLLSGSVWRNAWPHRYSASQSLRLPAESNSISRAGPRISRFGFPSIAGRRFSVMASRLRSWELRAQQISISFESNFPTVGQNSSRQRLSEPKCAGVRIAAGVEAARISTVSYGEEHPVDPGHNEAAWSKNRRDEFKVH